MNAQKILAVLGVGALLYYLYQRSQQPTVAAAPGATAFNPLQLPDLSLPAVQPFPVCPAGQIYDPALAQCMVTQYTAPV